MMRIWAVLSFVLLATLLVVPALGQTTAQDWADKGDALAEQGKYNESIQACDKAIELKPDLAMAWYNKGTVLGKDLGKYEEAIQCFDKAIELNPKYAEAWSNKGNVLSLAGQTR